MDRGAWRATVHGVTKSQTQLCNQHFPMKKVMNLTYMPGTRRGDLQKGYLGLFKTGENSPQRPPTVGEEMAWGRRS